MDTAPEPASVRSTTLVWTALIGMTLLSFAAFELGGAGAMRRAAVAIIMAISGIKAYLIFRYFMGLGSGPRSYRLTFIGWIVFCMVLITAARLAPLR